MSDPSLECSSLAEATQCFFESFSELPWCGRQLRDHFVPDLAVAGDLVLGLRGFGFYCQLLVVEVRVAILGPSGVLARAIWRPVKTIRFKVSAGLEILHPGALKPILEY